MAGTHGYLGTGCMMARASWDKDGDKCDKDFLKGRSSAHFLPAKVKFVCFNSYYRGEDSPRVTQAEAMIVS